mgnify:CR=1 FL=1|tara:strand:- start:20519 stop:20911 length:393 start_codon:yes stop_codon:yes gene_type:complete
MFKKIKSEEEMLLQKIFFGNKLYKDKYKLDWCPMCDTFTIACLKDKCDGSSCNGMGCEECIPEHTEFNKKKTSPYDYLSEEERETYEKIRSLNKLVEESLLKGEDEINWEKIAPNLSDNDRDRFKREIEK